MVPERVLRVVDWRWYVSKRRWIASILWYEIDRQSLESECRFPSRLRHGCSSTRCVVDRTAHRTSSLVLSNLNWKKKRLDRQRSVPMRYWRTGRGAEWFWLERRTPLPCSTERIGNSTTDFEYLIQRSAQIHRVLVDCGGPRVLTWSSSKRRAREKWQIFIDRYKSVTVESQGNKSFSAISRFAYCSRRPIDIFCAPFVLVHLIIICSVWSTLMHVGSSSVTRVRSLSSPNELN